VRRPRGDQRGYIQREISLQTDQREEFVADRP